VRACEDKNVINHESGESTALNGVRYV